jgi:2-keto-4-pentenoate hydratase/2-oxohepta-3-ene-1,7-dioic acid hydratase in catechol pathway
MLHPSLQCERESVVSFLLSSTEVLHQQLPEIERDADIEALHRFRVELRRIRTVLKSLGQILPVADAVDLAQECSWLAGRSSGLRDVDVFLHRLGDYLGEATPVDEAALRRLRAEFGRSRSRARAALLGSFRSKRAHSLVERLQALGTLAVAAPGWSDCPFTGPALWLAYRKVRKLGLRIDAHSPPEDLHELRKRCKRLRYLMEVYSPLFAGHEFDDMLRRLRKLQDVLGDYQDFDTHSAALLELRARAVQAGKLDLNYSVLIDHLLAALTLRSAQVRERFDKRFAQFIDERHHQRRRKLFRVDQCLERPRVGTQGYCHARPDATPLDLPVGKLVCVGRNYAAHAAELGNPVPEIPLLFMKPASAAVDLGPYIRIPSGRGSVHHELEIAVLIGTELASATPEQARAAIAGIGIGIDLTLRDLQDTLKAKSHPWEVAKAFDGSAPLSAFAPLDPQLDLNSLELRLVVNGRRRQFGSSAQMLTPIIELICYASTHFSLWPGDVVLTGTPQGVGPLLPGDRIVAELRGIVRASADIVA